MASYSAPFDYLAPDVKKRYFFGLSKDVSMASRLAKSAKMTQTAVHNFDRAESLAARLKEDKPFLLLLDWDTCEAESFKLLKEIRGNADFKSVPVLGYLSSGVKNEVREEAVRAGCHRVYTKTDFLKELDLILARFSKT